MSSSMDKEALEYHSKPIPGKVEVSSSKDCRTEHSLSLAYSPGVAAPCKEIAKDPTKVYDYTTKGQFGGRHHEWHRSFRIGQHRPLGRQTGHGR